MHVQKEMKDVQKQYEDIFNEIEGDDSDLLVVWPNDKKPSILCYPKFVSKNRIKNASKNRSKIDDKTFTCSKKCETISKGSIMKFVPDAMNEPTSIEFQNKKNILPSNFNNDLNLDQMNFLEVDNLKALSKSDLISVRESVSLEMLWMQQAIQSRVQVSKAF